MNNDDGWRALVQWAKEQQMTQADEAAMVTVKMRGRWGKQKARRLFGGVGGPLGEILAEEPGGVLVVAFKANDIISAINWLEPTQHQG